MELPRDRRLVDRPLVVDAGLLLAGSALGGAGYRRFRANERAIRAGVDIGGSGSATLLAAAVVLVPLLAAVVLTAIAVL